MPVRAKKWVLRSHFVGEPKREDLEIVEEELPPIKDGEFLCEAQWHSVDPYMRPYSARLPLGSTMIGSQVAKVIESKNKNFAVGDLIVGDLGWRTHTISNGEDGFIFKTAVKIDPSISLPSSTALGILGMPGATAYFGFLDICKPIKEGQTLVVTGAAGAVGSAVGQIGKIKGCRVVGFAGSDAKVEYLRSLGFDVAYNYKKITDLDATLKEACPNGIDLFFDNVGGEYFETVLANMNVFGRASICGAIGSYNATEVPKGHAVSPLFIFKQLKVEGFLVKRWLPQWPEAFKEMVQWIQEGRLKYNEHVVEGFDNLFDAFMGLFRGDNIGKMVIKA